jgi:hypothetical protein
MLVTGFSPIMLSRLPGVCISYPAAWATVRTTATSGVVSLRYGPIGPTLRTVVKVWVWETVVTVGTAVGTAVSGTGRLLAWGDVLGGAKGGVQGGIARSKIACFGEALHPFCELLDTAVHNASPHPILLPPEPYP